MTKTISDASFWVTVYGSASNKIDQSFKDAAFKAGAEIARRGWNQVNGGGNTGLMAAATDGGLSESGFVKVVILDRFAEAGYLHTEASEIVIVDSMPKRKAGLFEGVDGFLALPGGLGTFEEILEVLSWRQLGLHDKPIALLNVNGYYDPLVAMLTQSIEQKFTAHGFESCFRLSKDLEECLDFLKNPSQDKFDISSKV